MSTTFIAIFNRLLRRRSAVGLIAAMGVALSLTLSGVAEAAAWFRYPIEGTNGLPLNVRSGPGDGYPILRKNPAGTTVLVTCQTAGEDVFGNSVWDELYFGGYASDYYIGTPAVGTFSANIPRCSASPPPAPSPAPAPAPPAPPAPAPAPSGGTCHHAVGPFHVVPGTSRVENAAGQVFIPYGITVPGLANWGHGWQKTLGLDIQKINATADDWCANTVRLQVSQDNLLGVAGNHFYTAYMNAIDEEVKAAEDAGLVVVINDQTETAPQDIQSYQQDPTPGTEKFWKDIIAAKSPSPTDPGVTYGSDPQVIFDLFNEPRAPTGIPGTAPPAPPPTPGSGPSQAMWNLWADGSPGKYVGMKKLASDLRADGASNLFWLEGPDYASTFADMEHQGALLTTPNVVYAFHHPTGPHNTANWYTQFGYLTKTKPFEPVVDGEWTNYEPFRTKPHGPVAGGTGANSECWSDGYKTVPTYLSYLAKLGIGMTAYQLADGLLTNPDSDHPNQQGFGTVPTNIGPGYSCSVQSGPTQWGFGYLIEEWYLAHNR